MAAFNFKTFTDATVEAIAELQQKGSFDVYPNFNGQATAHPYAGSSNFTITGSAQEIQGMLWTALYGLAGPNTLTIQFPAPLLVVSTTVADYTLSGPGGTPSISSVTYGSGSSYTSLGSRNVVLNLSGPLTSGNTYTLSIGSQKVHSGGITDDCVTNGSITRVGTYNWPDYTVDVIMPAQQDVIGVGIAQVIDLGTPSAITDGGTHGVGIDQIVDLGTPVISTILATTGVGIDQIIDLGTPDSQPNANPTQHGFAQVIALGTPVCVQNAAPVGVGIVQTIALGTPVADINPLTPVGVGIIQTVNMGTPVVAGSGSVVGVGIAQAVTFGTPVAIKLNEQTTYGVGIDQIIDIGDPIMAEAATMMVDSWDQTIDVGTPFSNIITPEFGIGIDQPIVLGTPELTPFNPATGVGIAQAVTLGTPLLNVFIDTVGVGINQPIDIGTPFMNVAVVNGVGIDQPIAVGTPRAMLPLTISDRLYDAFLDLDAALQLAYADGVEGVVDPTLMAPIGDDDFNYKDDFTPLQQHQTKVPFENLACATWTSLNIPGAFPTTNDGDSVSIKAITDDDPGPEGTNGSLTFVDGMLVSKVDPT